MNWQWNMFNKMVPKHMQHAPGITVALLREFVANYFISCNTENFCPPLSCDLAPTNSFIWSYLKNSVYHTDNVNKLRRKITAKINEINANSYTLQNVINAVRRGSQTWLKQNITANTWYRDCNNKLQTRSKTVLGFWKFVFDSIFILSDYRQFQSLSWKFSDQKFMNLFDRVFYYSLGTTRQEEKIVLTKFVFRQRT